MKFLIQELQEDRWYLTRFRDRIPTTKFWISKEFEKRLKNKGRSLGDTINITDDNLQQLKEEEKIGPFSSTTPLSSGGQATQNAEEADDTVQSNSASLFVEIVSTPETDESGPYQLTVRTLAPHSDPGETKEVEVDLSNEQKKPHLGDTLRLFPASENQDLHLCRSLGLHPVAGDFIIDRDGTTWELINFDVTHPSARVVVRQRDNDEPTQQTLPFHELVQSDEKLRLSPQRDERTGSVVWEVVDRPTPNFTAPDTSELIDELHSGEATDAARQLRDKLEEGGFLSDALWAYLADYQLPDGRPACDIWRELRDEHLSSSWFHLRHELTLGELAATSSRDWNPSQIYNQFMTYLRDYIKKQDIQTLMPYWLKLSEVSPEEFELSTLTLSQLVELSEPARKGIVSVKKFQDICTTKLDADDYFGLGDSDLPEEAKTKLGWLSLEEALPSSDNWYRRYPIEKSTSGMRWIDEPCEPLAEVQQHIGSILNGYRAAHPAATGFVTGRSPALHARYHEGACCAVSVDIRDFFSSITHAQVRDALEGNRQVSPYRADRWANPFEGWSEHHKDKLAELVIHPKSGRLPQGAPSSPPIANLVAIELDQAIQQQLGNLEGSLGDWRYSRYADDLVISCTSPQSMKTLSEVRDLLIEALHQMEWSEAPEKTDIWRVGSGSLYICGIKVPLHTGEPLGLPRSKKRRLRSAIHHVEHDDGDDRDRGLISYAYDVTGEHRLRALSSPGTRAQIHQLGAALFSKQEASQFVNAWLAD